MHFFSQKGNVRGFIINPICLIYQKVIFSCSGNPKYEIMSNKVGYQFQSTLIIRDSTSEDFGYYGCAVTNSMGSDELSIHLEMQGK